MEPLEVIAYVPNPGNDPEFGSKNYLPRNTDLDPANYDSIQHGVIHSELGKLKLEEKDEEENVDEKIEESGWGGNSQNGWDYPNENENFSGWDGNDGWGEAEKKDEKSENSYHYPVRPDADYPNENENFSGWDGNDGWGEGEKKDERSENSYHYPVRPDAEDCAFFLKTGNCKFGSNCKFNHPLRRNSQENEHLVSHPRSRECKYYSKMGSCKFGETCRYYHTGPKRSDGSNQELNFMGLPVRPEEIECPHYMCTGSCKYGANCKFNHPDSTASVQSNHPRSGDYRSQSPRRTSQSATTSRSSSGIVNDETVLFGPVVTSPTPITPQNSEWNGSQVPVYPSERSMHQPTSYVVNKAGRKNNLQRQQMQVEEFPERPGQPECTFFLRTGDCKFKYTCKYHHPKNSNSNSTPCVVNDKGLPLRPDQKVCVHYSRYGICKFGPACKFDHPML